MEGKNVLGISTNSNSFPLVYPTSINKELNHYLGIAHFSSDNCYCSMIKNSKLTDKRTLYRELYSEKEIGSEIFVCSYEQRTKKIMKNSFCPLKLSYANRDWVFACNSSLDSSIKKKLEIEDCSLFFKKRASITEHIFYWLLKQIHAKSALSIEDFDYSELYRLIQFINSYGSINLLFSDGKDLVAYHDQEGKESLYGLKSPPQDDDHCFSFKNIRVEINQLDIDRPLIVFANQKEIHSGNHSFRFKPGQMLVARKSEVIYDSELDSTVKKLKNQKTKSKKNTLLRRIKRKKDTGPWILSEMTPQPFPPEVEGKGPQSTLTPHYTVYALNTKSDPVLYYITHTTTYHYSSPVHVSKHLFRLQPLHSLNQTLIKHKLTNSVQGKKYNFTGVFGNSSTIFDVTEPYRKMKVKSESIVAVSECLVQKYDLLYQQTTVPLVWMPWDRIMLQAYLIPPELPESELYELSDYAMSFVKANDYRIMDIVKNINTTIFKEFRYAPASTNLMTTPYEVYLKRKGVCQDFSNLFICLARLLNIPARYRVGYIYTGKDYTNKIQSDATHAWVELYLPNIGWLGFDPTNGCLESTNHIKMACGRNYLDATPTSGTIYEGGGKEKFSVKVQVKRLDGGLTEECMF